MITTEILSAYLSGRQGDSSFVFKKMVPKLQVKSGFVQAYKNDTTIKLDKTMNARAENYPKFKQMSGTRIYGSVEPLMDGQMITANQILDLGPETLDFEKQMRTGMAVDNIDRFLEWQFATQVETAITDETRNEGTTSTNWALDDLNKIMTNVNDILAPFNSMRAISGHRPNFIWCNPTVFQKIWSVRQALASDKTGVLKENLEAAAYFCNTPILEASANYNAGSDESPTWTDIWPENKLYYAYIDQSPSITAPKSTLCMMIEREDIGGQNPFVSEWEDELKNWHVAVRYNPGWFWVDLNCAYALTGMGF